MQIMFISNAPWTPSGYGVQTRLFGLRLKAAGHGVAITAAHGLQSAIITWRGLHIYPQGRDPYSQDIVGAHSSHFGADLTVTLHDAWVCDQRLYGPHVRWVPWLPIDCEPLAPSIREALRAPYEVLVYSRHGQGVLGRAGIETRYCPLGVDTSTFRPADRHDARERLGWPADRFIFGMVAANKSDDDRKAFAPQLAAFARFRRRHSDALLYLHTDLDAYQRGIDLRALLSHFELEPDRDYLISDPYLNYVGYPDRHMVDVYNAMDCLLACSAGEGFGVPLLEAQACGTPVLTGDWTAMPEHVFAGWVISKCDAEPQWATIGAWRYRPWVSALLDAMAMAYRDAGLPAMRAQAVAGAAQFDADRLIEQYWRPLLSELGERITAEQAAAMEPPRVLTLAGAGS